MNMNRSKKGFTLVEIMIVVVIIGLLAALAIPAFNKVRATSQDKAVLNNLRQISGAADQYFMENGVTTVATSALFGTGNYIAGSFSGLSPNATYPATVLATDTAVSATNIAGSTRSVSYNK